MNAETEMGTADGLGSTPCPTVEKAARSLIVGDLIKCDGRYREVFYVTVRAEDGEGEATELYVTVSDRQRHRRMTVPASLTLLVLDR